MAPEPSNISTIFDFSHFSMGKPVLFRLLLEFGEDVAKTLMVDQIFERLLFRKVYHFIGATMLFIGLGLDRNWFYALCIIYLVAFRIFGDRISFAVFGVLLLLTLSNSKFATLGAIVIWGIGDGVAPLFGSLSGQYRWPWNEQKTIAGSLSFLISSSISMLLFLWLLTSISLLQIVVLSILPSLSGCIAEMIPINLIGGRKPDDNLVVILSSGMVLYWLLILLNVQVII